MSKKYEFGVRNDANEALPLVLTVPEAAEKLRIGIGRCYELVRCGKLRNIKVGRRFLIPRTSIFEFLGVPDETLS